MMFKTSRTTTSKQKKRMASIASRLHLAGCGELPDRGRG
jgi:hypothetical protein